MLKIRSWGKWQRGILSSVKKSREARQRDGQNVAIDAPVSMQHISIATTWDRDFVDGFGELVGQRNAETYFIRVLQYVALHDGFTGECPVDRHEFGDLVLSRRRDKVSKKEGERVYDALLATGLADDVPVVTRSVTRSDTQPETRSEPLARARALPCPASPEQPPPVLAIAGGSASPLNGHDNGTISDSERRGVLAACGAILGQKDVAQDVRAATSRIQKAIRAGEASSNAVEDFVNGVVYAREPARIAYLSARKMP